MPTPGEYEDSYHNLGVVLDDFETTTVDVHRYRNNDLSDKDQGTDAALNRKDRLLEMMDKEIRRLRKTQLTIPIASRNAPRVTGPLKLDTSFLGSPTMFTEVLTNDSISIKMYLNVCACPTLSRVAELAGGRRGADPRSTNDDVGQRGQGITARDRPGTPPHRQVQTLRQEIQQHPDLGVRDYCERYIGLGCNGFVGNYARSVGLSRTPDTDIRTYAPPGARAGAFEEVKGNDVLVWTDNKHIAIIDSVVSLSREPNDRALDCRVVEATASNLAGRDDLKYGGLQNTLYRLRSVDSKKVFKAEHLKVAARVDSTSLRSPERARNRTARSAHASVLRRHLLAGTPLAVGRDGLGLRP